MKALIERFCQDDDGATAIEYAIIAVMISTAAVAAMTSLGTNLSAAWYKTAQGFNQ